METDIGKTMLISLIVIFAVTDHVLDAYDKTDQKFACVPEEIDTLTCNYIPEVVPAGYSKLRIANIDENETPACNEDSFKSIRSAVVSLEVIGIGNSQGRIDFFDNCFHNLRMLKELHINSNREFYLTQNAFLGLDNLELLDMSRCAKIPRNDIFNALNGKNKLPMLKKLLLSGTGINKDPYMIDDEFVQMLGQQNITYLDLSQTQMSLLNVTAIGKTLTQLEIINVSYSNINTVHDRLKVWDMAHSKLTSIDMSYATLPQPRWWIPFWIGSVSIHNITITDGRADDKEYLVVETLNVTGVYDFVDTSYSCYNCKFVLKRKFNWKTKTIVARQNNLKYLDFETICGEFAFYSLENLDVSNNKIEYIHPSVIACMPNIKTLHFAQNQLYKMVQTSTEMFVKLFSSEKLTHINLSENKLTILPQDIFGKNKNLEVLDLSRNKLQHITFDLKALTNLRRLDLSENKLRMLDTMSVQTLKSVPVFLDVINLTIDLNMNPLSCSVCDSYAAMKWLTETNFVKLSKDLRCVKEDGANDIISRHTPKEVQKICHRKVIIISCSITGFVTLIIICIMVKVIIKHKRRVLKQRKFAQLIENVQGGVRLNEFLVMLSYHSQDFNFIEQHVLTPLNESLQFMTGVERNLILTGDEHFRPGFYVHNEVARSLDRVSVVICLVTEDFSRSEYCLNEVNQALTQRKPTILMFKEDVNENQMAPELRTLYKKNTRILWTVVNGEYKLKTTWENVAKSIADLYLE